MAAEAHPGWKSWCFNPRTNSMMGFTSSLALRRSFFACWTASLQVQMISRKKSPGRPRMLCSQLHMNKERVVMRLIMVTAHWSLNLTACRYLSPAHRVIKIKGLIAVKWENTLCFDLYQEVGDDGRWSYHHGSSALFHRAFVVVIDR